MTEPKDFPARLAALIDERVALETRLDHSDPGAVAEAYEQLQLRLAGLLRDGEDQRDRITALLELLRIFENRLIQAQSASIDFGEPTRGLALLVAHALDDLRAERSSVLTPLELTYYAAIVALYAGDRESARAGFSAACASEESDEANDVKYKSFVLLGHLSQEEGAYAEAKELHGASMRYSANANVTAQALALKALNAYAMQEHDEALRLFGESLALFDETQPFFNSYFHRNALLFCGAIHFDRSEWDQAESFYRRVVEIVDEDSFDYFDALAHLGRIACTRKRWDEAVAVFEKAIRAQRFSENEYLVDTWFWIARCHMRRNDPQAARPYLERITASEVAYPKKPQALELLQRIA